MIAHLRKVPNQLTAIRFVTVLLMWGLIGGRGYCSWVCPYHFVAEWAEKLHLKLAERGWVHDHAFHRGVRTVFWGLFALLASSPMIPVATPPRAIAVRTMALQHHDELVVEFDRPMRKATKDVRSGCCS